MRIGIDGRLYTQTGVGRYIRNLITELSKLDYDNEYIVYLRKEEYESFVPFGINWVKRLADIRWHTVKEQFVFPKLLMQDKLDVAHFPYFNVPIFYPGKYLLTIHDLIVDHFDTGRASTLPYPLYLAKRIGYKVSLSLGIKKANWITAISNTTKKEIIEHYNFSKDKITVTYDALDTSFLNSIETQKTENYYKFPYILYVGNAYPHKNLKRLIDAFILIKIKAKIKLVLAGDDNFFYPRLKKYTDKLGLSEDIIFFGNADDKQLINLYSFAQSLIFPSLMEGFGLPNFEAIACGKLPVMSDIPVFREIWNDDVTYFNPNNENEIATKILSVINLPEEKYKNKVEILKKRLDDFNWKNTAEETLKIYKSINQK